jgi:hypothetical protein
MAHCFTDATVVTMASGHRKALLASNVGCVRPPKRSSSARFAVFEQAGTQSGLGGFVGPVRESGRNTRQRLCAATTTPLTQRKKAVGSCHSVLRFTARHLPAPPLAEAGKLLAFSARTNSKRPEHFRSRSTGRLAARVRGAAPPRCHFKLISNGLRESDEHRPHLRRFNWPQPCPPPEWLQTSVRAKP